MTDKADMSKPKTRENAVTVNVGSRLRRAMNEAQRSRREEDPLADKLKDADIVRDALRAWFKDSPYAMNAAEMWLLRASRAMKAREPESWASAMRGFGGHLRDITNDRNLEDSLNEIITEVSNSADAGEDRRQVRGTRKRKAS